MTRRRTPDMPLEHLLSPNGDGSATLRDRCRVLHEMRRRTPELAERFDEAALREIDRLRAGLAAAQESQKELRELLRAATEPPWHEATYLGSVETGFGPRALVLQGGARRVVSLGDGVGLESLRRGDAVFLGGNLNTILARTEPTGSGESAVFERYLPGGRAVLRSRDEEIVVELAGALDERGLRAGDLVRWERGAWIAHEKLERGRDSRFFLEETPPESFDDVGGLDAQIRDIQRSLLLHVRHAAVADKYALGRLGSVLLDGPPGTGKTLLAKALANWAARMTAAGRSRFAHVKPGALSSVWFGESERNVREVFRSAREMAGAEGVPVIIFFDEVDSIGAARGAAVHRVDDRILTAFAAELDGLESRGNVFVVAATNRRDALDECLARPGRLGDKVIEVPRPVRKAAGDILRKHLPAGIPYAAGDGSDQGGLRDSMIETALSRIYAPNGEGELASVLLRDGKRRPVRPPDLISGAVIANVCRTAIERAAIREVETGEEEGLRLEDLLAALSAELETAVRGLSPGNCRRFLADLPRDVDVVEVEPVPKKTAVHRYVSLRPELAGAER